MKITKKLLSNFEDPKLARNIFEDIGEDVLSHLKKQLNLTTIKTEFSFLNPSEIDGLDEVQIDKNLPNIILRVNLEKTKCEKVAVAEELSKYYFSLPEEIRGNFVFEVLFDEDKK